MSVFSLLPLILQVGMAPGTGTASGLPPELIEQRALTRQREAAQQDADAPPPQSKLGRCLSLAMQDAPAARTMANGWLARAQGRDAAEAGHCLGLAESRLGEWGAARSALELARQTLPDSEHGYRARLGAMAGNAALAAGDAPSALPLLNAAQADAASAGDPKLLAGIETDRARALVGMGNLAEAAKVLGEARASDPGNASAWLLSATLSRRMERLDDAQTQIEQAGKLDPRNPQVALEAGLIAALAGRDEAARKSWDSVLTLAPESPEAAAARDYLKQLGPQSGAQSEPEPGPQGQ